MSKKFPHLQGANGWPGLDTVAPFDFEVSFDPYVWQAGIEIHLCRVRHDLDYQNIIAWESASARDAYYDRISDRSFVLETEMHIEPGQEIKLPVPLDVLQGYNYLFIDFPAPPVEYGSQAGTGTRYYYFLRGTSFRAPSTTAAEIYMDQWTSHCTELQMRYIRLERGHAPLAAVDPAWYLGDPMNRCEHLSVADETAGGGSGRIRHIETQVFNAGEMLAVLVFDSPPLADSGSIGQDGWHTPQSNYMAVQGAYGIALLGFLPQDLGPYLDRLYEHAPQVVPTIQACYMIDRDLVDTTGTRTLWGITAYELGAARRVRQFLDLDVDMFGIPPQYRSIAKLYTDPYSWIEITDDKGIKSRIRIEDTRGRLRLSVAASLAYPGIGIDACVLGIGDGEDYVLGWNNFTGHSMTVAGDWTSVLRHWSIPTYLITQDPSRSYWYRNYWQITQAQDANATAEGLSYRTASANYSMRIAAIDRASARLSQQQENDTAQMQLSQQVTAQSAEQSKEKIDRDHDADLTMLSALNAAQNQGIALAASQAAATGAQQQQVAKTQQGLAIQNVEDVQVQGNFSVASAQLTGFADALGGSISGAASGAEGGAAGILGGAASGAITSGINGGVAIEGAMISRDIANRQAVGAAQLSTLALEGAKLSTSQAQASYVLAASNNDQIEYESKQQMAKKRDSAKNFITRQSSMMQAMQGNSLATQQSYQRAIQNGDNALARSQASTTKGLADASTAATKRLQDASIDRTARAAALSTPIIITQSSGSSSDITSPMCMQATVKTIDNGAMAQVGDAFLTYGYRYGGREWRISTLTPMQHFSYWEGDPQIGANTVTGDTYETIRDIFRAGVFVWDAEESIGSTSIYNNERRS